MRVALLAAGNPCSVRGVSQEDGVIIAVGTSDEPHWKYPTAPVIGTGNEILLPGFVNGHHHVGLTPVQLDSTTTATCRSS